MSKIVEDFPKDICNIYSTEDANPAVKLFGRRFFGDQQVVDLLSEFFLIVASTKKIGSAKFDRPLPSMKELKSWPEDNELKYFPEAKLNLKLFSFLGSSKLETRHETHREHCKELWQKLKNSINSDDSSEKEETLIMLNNLFLGFWGSGADRTWCAQNFLPFCKGVLTGESLWNETEANKYDDLHTWNKILDDYSKFFTMNKHRFLGRGGEMLYLQLCNALRQDTQKVENWLKDSGRFDYLTIVERNPETLHTALESALEKFFAKTPGQLNNLVDFIDSGVEAETSYVSDQKDRGGRKVTCGWCAEESWHESYLFAVELLRLLNTNIDIMETCDLLQIACAMQLMRSLAAQSYRHSPNFQNIKDGLVYRLLLTDPNSANRRERERSRHCLIDVGREIHDALRINKIKQSVPDEDIARLYKEADSRYGYKLYLKTGKNIGLIIPRRGACARFVLTEKILRYFVLTLIPNQRMTLDSFKKLIELHHGFVFEEIALASSPNYQNKVEQLNDDTHTQNYLEKMLDAAGVLVKLSDHCSLVKNPFKMEQK